MIPRDHNLADRILDLIPINSLDRRLQDAVLKNGHVLELRRKKKLFKEGARDKYTFYLLDGELELQTKGEPPVRMRAGDTNARRALAQLQPRRYTAVALTQASVFRIERGFLDHIISDGQVVDGAGGGTSDGVVEVEELEDDEGADWMTRLISSELFTRLPHDNIQRFFTELEPMPVDTGDVIVEQGTQGDFLYILAEGKCQVTRRAPGSDKELQLAVLKEGDTFGEEALISNSPRNASVKMLTPGFVMRLPKQKFLELVSKPTLNAVSYAQACRLIDEGAMWVDVRFPDEHEANAIKNSRNIPLNVLRMEAPKLDSSCHYVVYCDTGARSSTGAFLMAGIGLNVSYLSGGLERTPLAKGTMPAAGKAGAGPVSNRAAAAADEAASALDKAAQAARGPTGFRPMPAASAKSPAAPAPSKSQAATASAPVDTRAELARLKAERDRAVETAERLKRQIEAQKKSLEAEQNKRETLEKDLATVKADAERKSGIEKSRLESELAKALKKVKELHKVREQLESRLTSAQQEHKQALEQTGDIQADKVRAAKAERERDELRSQLEGARAELEKLREIRRPGKLDLERAMKDAGMDLKDARAKVAAERAELNATVEKVETMRKEAEAQIAREREALAHEAAAQRERSESLKQKEQAVEELRATAETELKQREEALAKAEAALSAEKAAWSKQIEQAIADERARMEKAYAEYKQKTQAAAKERARELAEQQLAEAREAMKAKVAQIRAEADARVGAVRTEFKEFAASASSRTEALVAKVRAELEGERRRLENENARLRKVMTEAGRGAELPPQAPRQSPADLRIEEPDLEIQNVGAGDETMDFAKEPTDAMPELEIHEDGRGLANFGQTSSAGSGPDLELEEDRQALDPADAAPGHESREREMTLEEFVNEPGNHLPDLELEEQKPHRAAAPAPARKQAASAVPKLDAGDTDDEDAGKEQVLTPAQIAEIRRKMKEKMKASKKSA